MSSRNNSTRRFSDRVENYVKYRPSYPAAVIPLLQRETGMHEGWAVADVGSGTGISTKLLLESGCRVHAVEPNREMRQAAEAMLEGNPRFMSVDGTAEATTLPDASMDMVVAAQAFHWFDPQTTRLEFTRILRPGGRVVLMWNARKLDATPFLKGYEELLLKHATDYKEIRHEIVSEEKLTQFFLDGKWSAHLLPNSQEFDLEGLCGRLLSSSYAPAPGHPGHEAMMRDLDELFREHQVNGRVRFDYDTQVFIGH